MINLASTSDLIRVVSSHAAQLEVHASWVDLNGTTVTPGRTNTPHITTATTTTVVGSPAASTVRNVKHLNITNDHASQSCIVTVEHYDGTTAIELMAFTLLPGENMIFNAEGRWAHRDSQGAEYPPAGLGSYNGRTIGFMKTGTAADAAGYWYCTSKDAGFPGAWAVGTPGVNGRVTDGTAAADNGCFPIANPSVGANYLTEVNMASGVNHTHLLFDVLWVNSGLAITTTGAQAITTPTLPARDINGTTNGEGCSIALLCTAAVGLAAVASNATVTYTNSDGTGSRTATLSAIVGSQAPATPVNGTLIWFNLQAGDKGVRSIQSISLNTSWVSGSISLMITRDIATIGTTIPNVNAQKIIGTPGIRLYNGTCLLHCNLASATTATFYAGELVVMEK
ncbi:MAG: hypothetical protein QG638_2749 [Pseudomonadota bacterium]|nr:hypothetical protein [Pseudomonadota bacterium]MDQ5905101.1 hypothetical protein [Pseudomonadota bacterium]MDQ5907764.1 hypothetical protein [Pseudomonadota bacterium]